MLYPRCCLLCKSRKNASGRRFYTFLERAEKVSGDFFCLDETFQWAFYVCIKARRIWINPVFLKPTKKKQPHICFLANFISTESYKWIHVFTCLLFPLGTGNWKRTGNNKQVIEMNMVCITPSTPDGWWMTCRCLFSIFWLAKLLVQRSHMSLSLWLSGGGGTGEGGGGKSTLASAETPSKSRRSSSTGRCTFMCLFPVKALTAYSARKPSRLTMNRFSMSLQTTLSGKTPIAKIANIHL